jgi:uncharacterized damage-inducible protein DinB
MLSSRSSAVTVEQLRCLSAYNRWANTRLLQTAATLGTAELERDLGASFRSLQGTLIHLLWGERGWLRFWQIGEFVPKPAPGDYPDLASLRRAWQDHQEAYECFMRGLTQTDLDAPRTLDATLYTLGELVQHALNHSTYHRGQVALLIRQLGNQPAHTDYHDFLEETRGRTA